MSHPLFDQFRRDIAAAQKRANQKNCGVHVYVEGQQGNLSTFVEPNLPKFTKKEVETRFQTMMEEDEADSVSILARPSKLSKSKGINYVELRKILY